MALAERPARQRGLKRARRGSLDDAQECHLSFDVDLRRQLDAYSKREGVVLAEAVRRLVQDALQTDKDRRLDQGWHDSTAERELAYLRAESAYRFQFDRRVARATFAIERLLAHWCAQSTGMDEDELFAEIEAAGRDLVKQVLQEPDDEHELAEGGDAPDDPSGPH